MKQRFGFLTLALCALVSTGIANTALADDDDDGGRGYHNPHAANKKVSLGPRPYYLVEQMESGKLKRQLQSCGKGPFRKTLFSIGHRGAPLQFPEHTKESYVAAARMGAGIVECDVAFTKDAELVCRHAQCDLHTTTNILATDLAAKCRKPFEPAEFDPNTGALIKPASAKCCANDLTLAEFKSLKGKMDARDARATTVDAYLGGTADFRTDLYTTGGTLLTHKESIALFTHLGVGMTPELKGIDSEVGFGESGLTQETYARKMIEDYIHAGVRPRKVWAQSFNLDDVRQWIAEFPRYGRQAVFLDGRNVAELADNPPPLKAFSDLNKEGLNIIAPPMPVLLTANDKGKIKASTYAKRARRAGLDIITWTSERSGRIVEDVLEGGSTFYYQTTLDALRNDGDIMKTIDVLARDVGVIGIFSDWPATTSYYANCFRRK